MGPPPAHQSQQPRFYSSGQQGGQGPPPASQQQYPAGHHSSQIPRQGNSGQASTGPLQPKQGQAQQQPSQHLQSSPRIVPGGVPYNRLKVKLQQRIPVFGVWLSIPSPVTARMLAQQGFDWACIDMEHTPTNPALMSEMIAAVASSGTCTPIVRVPSHSPEWFKWALDAGAQGIIVPMVNTAEEMRNAEQMCRYPPLGKRSMGAFLAPGMFNLRGPRAMNEYIERASRDILVIPQIESAEGVANLSGIIKAGGMDAIFIGPYDLSASMRAAQQDIPYQDALAHVEKIAHDSDVPIGIYASSGMTAWKKLNEGYTMLVAASDIDCLASSAAENLDRARGDNRPYR
ncbi:Pyruvate/Phosphoenolpyruvate kinase-like domain-containing protein [Kickxella alabastrina]|uniref:Pyruvate/Phosphoenolpyruvate kinase-like domain-containing protein n=1 Tax=Kickxella alabastrina TaxID=61397 RepID=UPI0022209F1C|nr:Pyruvate/Phosphoenolpyruvate kinase-like domain-containing protein [Kickxella alabastrina]KAI7823975.1 Pyruvate/Phosphoenolpyruvate kinase-like domain-containing protein [Kickxella alabastrina]